MQALGWQPTYLARCPVTLYEAARGSTTWQTGSMGELHMRSLGGAVLTFQLHDILDGQVLFEHTMRKPDAMTIPVERFFVIRQENGSFHAFGFKDRDAANEMKERIQKSVKPFPIRCFVNTDKTELEGKVQSHTHTHQPQQPSQKKSVSLSCESVPKQSAFRNKSFHKGRKLPEHSPSQPPIEKAVFSARPQKSNASSRWHKIKKGIFSLPHLFGSKEHEMEIGYPTDVKHVAHIGWDGPTVNGSSWMEELRPAPDFSMAPFSDFGQPQNPSWIHDAASAARWTSQGLLEVDVPPPPPPEYTISNESKHGRPKLFSSKSKKAFFNKQNK